jgi:CRISPR-associated endoribonuclease Cas6
MRIQLKVSTTKNELPIEYRKAIMSFIKNSMKNASETLYEKYYNNCDKKRFTFSTFIPGLKNCENKILKEGYEFYINISTLDENLGYLMVNMFNQSKGKPYPLSNENYMILTSVNTIKEENITSDTIVVKTMSPICLLEHYKGNNKLDKYHSIESSIFTTMLKDRYNIEFVNIDCKKVIVKHQNLKIETTSGTFVLKGNPNVLNSLYRSGLGNRCGQGFGMFEILK